jgi:hypothetical protein
VLHWQLPHELPKPAQWGGARGAGGGPLVPVAYA